MTSPTQIPGIFPVSFVTLANGRGVAAFDTPDAEHVGGLSWYRNTSKHGLTSYAATSMWQQGRSRVVLMHRLLNPDVPEQDHFDGNGLNNCRSNLRTCTHSENHAARPLQRNSTSGFKGVSYAKRERLWRAYIVKMRRQQGLGYFTTAEEAARAYDRAALTAFGEFARLNFPRSEQEQ